MRKSFVAVAAALLGISAAGTMAPALATQPDPDGEHKVWVCHATAGEGELKNGYNLIYVDVASTVPNDSFHGENDHYGHATTSPKDNSKYGLLYDYLNVGPDSTCGAPEMPSKDAVEVMIGSEPDCDTLTVTETYDVTEYTYTWDGTTWVESESTTQDVRTRDMTDEEAAACPTEESQGPVPPAPPTVVETPVAETPVAETPVAETPAPVAETPQVAAAPTALPSTGSETWAIFLIGLATLLAGAGLLVLSHRPA